MPWPIDWVALGERAWEQEARWGEWQIPNTELPLLADEMHGQRAIELGCGTGYVSAWMRRRGASVYAIDNSEAQLATARRLSELHGLDDIEWVHGNAETVAQPDGSFDFAISEYGAAIWCEPATWITEAHRLLRPGGELVFLGNHPLAMVCSPIDGSLPVTERLERPYFDLGRLDWRDAVDEPGGIEFNLPISSWMRLFHDIGFDVHRLHRDPGARVRDRQEGHGDRRLGQTLPLRAGLAHPQTVGRWPTCWYR